MAGQQDDTTRETTQRKINALLRYHLDCQKQVSATARLLRASTLPVPSAIEAVLDHLGHFSNADAGFFLVRKGTEQSDFAWSPAGIDWHLSTLGFLDPETLPTISTRLAEAGFLSISSRNELGEEQTTDTEILEKAGVEGLTIRSLVLGDTTYSLGLVSLRSPLPWPVECDFLFDTVAHLLATFHARESGIAPITTNTDPEEADDEEIGLTAADVEKLRELMATIRKESESALADLESDATGEDVLKRIASAARSAERLCAQSPASRGGNRSVLIIDEDDLARTVTRRLLMRLGYHVVGAANVREAVELPDAIRHVEAALVDLPLALATDAQDPGQELRQRFGGDLSIVLMGERTACEESGLQVAGLLEKPFGPRQLDQILRMVLADAPESGSPIR